MNAEKRVFSRVLRVSATRFANDAGGQPVWVDLGREDKALMDLVKSFIRCARARAKPKQAALALIGRPALGSQARRRSRGRAPKTSSKKA